MTPPYFFMEKKGMEHPTSKNCGQPSDPITTITMNTFSPPPLAPDQNPCTLSPTTPPMGAE